VTADRPRRAAEEWPEVYTGPTDQAPNGTPAAAGPLPPAWDGGNGTPLSRVVTVMNPQGIHMRPAAAFAKAAREFKSTVTVRRDDKAVNGKSQLDLLLLAAEPGAQLVVEVCGDDAPGALEALGSILEAVFDDEGGMGPPPKG
jgi:phosphotransferase system HPr (HPr) family protein